jgi:ribonuclease D
MVCVRMQGAMGTCLERSRQICLQRYEKPLFRDSDYLSVYHRLGTQLTPQQLAVFAALYAWRDSVARSLDQGCHQVLAKRRMLSLAQAMPATEAAVSRIVGRSSSAANDAAADVRLLSLGLHSSGYQSAVCWLALLSSVSVPDDSGCPRCASGLLISHGDP